MRLDRSPILFFLFLLCTQFLLGTPLSLAETENETFGRACLLVEEAGSTLENQVPTVSAFDETSQSGHGKRLILQADASENCFILAVAFNRQDGGLTAGWRPQLTELAAWEETQLPGQPVVWDWSQPTDPFEFFVVFLEPDAPSLPELGNLTQALQNLEADPKLVELQAGRLREIVNEGLSGQNPSQFLAGMKPSAWGGTLRGAKFPWRPMAQKAGFGRGKSGFVIYRYGA